MAPVGFADRLAYVRLIRWLRSGKRAPETDGEFAASVGVTPGWLAKWKIRDDSPDRRTETDAILSALADIGVTSDWLFDGNGVPPEPARWKEWLAARVLAVQTKSGATPSPHTKTRAGKASAKANRGKRA